MSITELLECRDRRARVASWYMIGHKIPRTSSYHLFQQK
jgi:hypothetical protein